MRKKSRQISNRGQLGGSARLGVTAVAAVGKRQGAEINVTELLDIGLRFNAAVAAFIDQAPILGEVVVAASLCGVQLGLKSETAKQLMAAVASVECDHIRQLALRNGSARK